MVDIQQVDFAYPGKQLLFRGLSAELKPGNIYGLLGQNGAGKTSLLKLITGLLKPKHGSCSVLNYESGKRIPQMLAEAYIIPEEFQLPGIKISEYVKINGAFYPRFDHEQFDRLMNEFSLNKQEKLSKLSYGQKKKVLLSFGLATNSKLLILDEPTNGLDIPSKSQFRRILASSLSEERIFIISTHQVRDMESLIDPVIVLDDGQIIFNRSMEEITKNLAFKVIRNGEEPKGLLYGEEIMNGKAGIVENDGSEETQVNMELLFNGIIHKGKEINHAFKK
jgi:ABC-2 type transport system ATP-binding protein